jgi:hypothetical protein
MTASNTLFILVFDARHGICLISTKNRSETLADMKVTSRTQSQYHTNAGKIQVDGSDIANHVS